MSDDRFEDFVRRAARNYHTPLEVPREAMWARIVAARAARKVERERRRPVPGSWVRWGLAAAAVLAVGIGIGLSIGPSPRPVGTPLADVPTPGATQIPTAFQVAAYDHLRHVETFLEVFRADARSRGLPETAATARGLLENTRLLMDSPAGKDPRFVVLLDDVEVVLAQIASYSGDPDHADLQLIEQGIEQRGLLTKLRAIAPATYAVARVQGVL